MRSSVIAIAVALAVGLSPLPAGAQRARRGGTAAEASSAASAQVTTARDEEARGLFSAGRAAMSEGRYEDALSYFERAYELSPRPALLFNIGAVSERLRREEQALEAYRAYLEVAPDAENRLDVERRIAILEDAIASRGSWIIETDVLAPDATPPSEPRVEREADGADVPLIVGLSVGGAALIAGAIVLAVVLGGSAGVEEPLPGGSGVVVTTLVRF